MSHRFGRTQLLKMAWRHGRNAERGLVVLLLMLPSLALLTVMGVWADALLGRLSTAETVVITLSLIGASFTWFLYEPAILRPLSGATILRGIIGAGSLTDSDRDYLTEVARYKESQGVGGQVPGDVATAYASSLIFAFLYLGGVSVSLEFYVSLGVLAPVLVTLGTIWIGILCFWFFVRKIRREAERAAALGFRLRELRAAAGRGGRSRVRH